MKWKTQLVQRNCKQCRRLHLHPSAAPRCTYIYIYTHVMRGNTCPNPASAVGAAMPVTNCVSESTRNGPQGSRFSRSSSAFLFDPCLFTPTILSISFGERLHPPCSLAMLFPGGVAPSCGHSSSSKSSEVQRAPGSSTALGFPVKALLQTNHLRIH